MVELVNIHKSYGNKIVLDNFNYSFSDKGLYLIMGKSGCGKTTLLNIISNVDKKYIGKVICNKDFCYIRVEDLIGNFTVKEEINLIKEIYTNFKEKTEMFGLESLYNKKIDKLSLGEKQRLCIYLSICSNANIVLLDEPLAFLDETNKEKIVKMIKTESRKRLFIVVTHDIFKFKDFKLIKLDKKRNGKFISIKEAITTYNEKKKINSFNLAKLLIKKSFLSLCVFIVALCGFGFSTCIINDELGKIKTNLDESFNEGNLFYKENNTKLNSDVFYNEVVVKLAKEIVNYGNSLYSEKMYDHKVYLDKYYLDNGFLFSNVFLGKDIKENEIIVSMDFERFCLNNNMIYCLESSIKDSLIGKDLIYKGENSYTYKIKDIVSGTNAIYVNNYLSLKKLYNNEFKEYYSKYYISVYSKKLEQFYKKINTIDSLLKYDYNLYFEDEDCNYFLVSESRHKYFSYDELKKNNLVGCSEIISCDAFNFTKLTSLKYMNNIEVFNKIKFKAVSEKLEYNEVIISSSLRKLLNVNKGDNITLKYSIEDKMYVSNVVIKNIKENDDFVIYQNSNYTHDVVLTMSGKASRIEYAYGKSEEYKSSLLLHEEVIKSIMEIMNKFYLVLNLVIVFMSLIIIGILFYIENKRCNKYFSLYKYLKKENVENYIKVFSTYSFIYVLIGLFVFNLSILIGCVYTIVFLIFYFKYKGKIKTQVSLG